MMQRLNSVHQADTSLLTCGRLTYCFIPKFPIAFTVRATHFGALIHPDQRSRSRLKLPDPLGTKALPPPPASQPYSQSSFLTLFVDCFHSFVRQDRVSTITTWFNLSSRTRLGVAFQNRREVVLRTTNPTVQDQAHTDIQVISGSTDLQVSLRRHVR